MKNLTMIAAIGKNHELGKNNDLIWHIKEDMKFFKNATTNHHIVMGRNTFDSLPKVLPNRTSIVLTRQDIIFPEGVIRCPSLDEFLSLAENIDDDIFVIGGESIYRALYDYATMIYLTEIDAVCPDATVFFPEIIEDEWDTQIIDDYSNEELPYVRKLYKRKNI